ncbi:hypothetical protein SH668x_003744 [Planctomicrobium sp. SH668]|uniref:hypothetical protein n=1 Tax=Planctomicrobium sp. SH668 TaxID=3448126 RepID=UPI003F5C289C
MIPTHGIRFDQTQFWITHRRREYGPFDYDWSPDMQGLELLYQGIKFGEVCTEGELFADMREFRLPLRVVEVACVVMGCIVMGVGGGFSEEERKGILVDTLHEFDCGRFAPRIN